jgi:hypothetical protein
MNDAPEGWRVPQRVAFIAAAAVPMVLLAALLLAGRLYDDRLRPAHRQPVTTFPAPGVETFIHDGGHDPHRPAPRARADAALVSAKQQVVAGGLSNWAAPR